MSLAGFRTYVQTGIVLQVNANPVINAFAFSEGSAVAGKVDIREDREWLGSHAFGRELL